MNILLSEEKLVHDCTAGKPAAQKALWDLYCNDMLILCCRYISNREEAEEALMDGFLRCFKSINTFQYRGVGSLKAWLKKIVVNSCLMKLRKQSKVFETLAEEVDVGVDGNLLEVISAKEILLFIHQLPPGYRTVFNLFFFEDLTHREIALLLGISENTSKSQLAKAKTALQQMLLAHQ